MAQKGAGGCVWASARCRWRGARAESPRGDGGKLRHGTRWCTRGSAELHSPVDNLPCSLLLRGVTTWDVAGGDTERGAAVGRGDGCCVPRVERCGPGGKSWCAHGQGAVPGPCGGTSGDSGVMQGPGDEPRCRAASTRSSKAVTGNAHGLQAGPAGHPSGLAAKGKRCVWGGGRG